MIRNWAVPAKLAALCLLTLGFISKPVRADDGVAGELPDAPSSSVAEAQKAQATSAMRTQENVAKRYQRVILADQTALPLSGEQKFVLSLRSMASLTNTGVNVLNAGFLQLVDERPHYGTDKGAFAARFGAVELKDATQTIIGWGIAAPILHEDPRYYILGDEHKLMHRVVYSASRSIITRHDNGSTGPNYYNMIGIASANSLTNLYYPSQDRGARETLESIAVSFATNAGSNVFHEFEDDLLRFVHLKK